MFRFLSCYPTPVITSTRPQNVWPQILKSSHAYQINTTANKKIKSARHNKHIFPGIEILLCVLEGNRTIYGDGGVTAKKWFRQFCIFWPWARNFNFQWVTLPSPRPVKVKVKVWTLVIAPLTWVRHVTSSALQSRKWQLIGMSQWCRSALCGHLLPALTDNWTHVAASRHTIAPITRTRPSPRSRSYYSFPVPLRVGGWAGLSTQ